MSEVKAVQEEVVPEKRGATENVTEEPAAAPQNAAAHPLPLFECRRQARPSSGT